MRNAIFAAVASLVVSAPVAAQQLYQQAPLMNYGEIGFTSVKIEDSGFSFTPKAVRLLLGQEFHPNFAVDVMGAFGVQDDSISVGGITVTGDLKYGVGLYAVPKIKFGNAEVFARLGAIKAEAKASAMGMSVTESGTDFSYGAGVRYTFTRNHFIAADWMQYYDKNGIDAKGWTISLGSWF